MRIVKIRLPLYIKTSNGKKGTVNLSLNSYKVWCSNVHRERKVREAVKELLEISVNRVFKDEKSFPTIYVHYMFHRKSNMKFDMGNYQSVIEKYFLDTLTKMKIIPDDSWNLVVWGSYSMYPELDKDAPMNYINAYISDKPLFEPKQKFLEFIND